MKMSHGYMMNNETFYTELVERLQHYAGGKMLGENRTARQMDEWAAATAIERMSRALKRLLSNIDEFGYVTDYEFVDDGYQAIAMETAKPDRPRSGLDPKGDSAGPKDIAQKDHPHA
jgi:hypothetical protein